MEFLEGHLGYLSQYAENFKHSTKVQEVCIRIERHPTLREKGDALKPLGSIFRLWRSAQLLYGYTESLS